MTDYAHTAYRERQAALAATHNTSGITPVGCRVLVCPIPVKDTHGSGVIQKARGEQEREQLSQVHGVVVAVGDTAYKDQPHPYCSVGDTVIFAKFAGQLNKGSDGRTYHLMNDLQIAAITRPNSETIPLLRELGFEVSND